MSSKNVTADAALVAVSARVNHVPEQRLADEALRESERRYRQLVEQVTDGIFVADENGRYIDVNPAGCEMLGMTREEVLKSTFTDVLVSEDHPRLPETVASFADGAVHRSEWRFRRKDGSVFVGELAGRKLADGTLQGVLRDITERKEMEQRLRESDDRQSFLLKLSDTLRLLADPVSIQVTAARILGEHLGANRVLYIEIVNGTEAVISRDWVHGVRSIAGRYPSETFGQNGAETLDAHRVFVCENVATDPTLTETNRKFFEAADVAASLRISLVKGGRWVASLGVHSATPRVWTDTEIKQVEETAERTWAAVERAKIESSLRESELRLSTILENLPIGVGLFDSTGRFVERNPVLRSLTGDTIPSRTPGASEWRGFDETGRLLAPSEYPGARALRGESAPESDFVTNSGGEEQWIRVMAAPLVQSGTVIGGVAIARDVTERRRSQQALQESEAKLAKANADLESRITERSRQLEEEMRRREEVQAALAQSQRMEALGQLTGGIAHDFNNLLTVVSGNLELAEPRIVDPTARQSVRRAIEAVEMGASLNRRLLSFARRSELAPTRTNLNDRVNEMQVLLKRTLGEEVTLSTQLDASLWPTRADPGEIDSAIINIAINARDAMPTGGTLTLVTRKVTLDASAAREWNTKPGDYVCLSLSDTGHGMTPEVLRRAVEPLFTTKAMGKGTGLGLSGVYGFARQSGGFLDIWSEVGKGTTVSIFLPRAAEEVAGDKRERKSDDIPTGDGELILVVEDNNQVLEVTLARLEALGYAVIEARSEPEAIEVLKSGAAIALVFTDVVMPGGMTGYDVARWALSAKPNLRLLLTSGNEEPARREAEEVTGLRVLTKPYTRAQLSHAIHDALVS